MRSFDLALGEAEERQARLGLSSPAHRLPKCLLGLAELSPQTVQLSLHVEGRAGRIRILRLGEEGACVLDFLVRIVPFAVAEHNLCPVDETFAPKRHHLRLRGAPDA